MGTGVRTSLPRIVADELEADWNRVKVVQAEGDPRYGSQDTDGSHSVREFFDTMREAGAEEFISLVERHYGPVVEYFLSYRVNSQ
jgi:CO/xanthine dehydrogenase Mo-binding subunit